MKLLIYFQTLCLPSEDQIAGVEVSLHSLTSWTSPSMTSTLMQSFSLYCSLLWTILTKWKVHKTVTYPFVRLSKGLQGYDLFQHGEDNNHCDHMRNHVT